MNRSDRSVLEATVSAGGTFAIRNLAAAEAAVLRGQFNLAKVLRAVAHAQRIRAMEAARLLVRDNSAEPFADFGSDNAGGAEAVENGNAIASTTAFESYTVRANRVQARVDDIVRRARESLANQSDVPESVVAQQIWGCYGCGDLIEGEQPESCPTCGALGVEFEWFGPFYSSTPEHLGSLSPTSILEILEAGPGEVASLLTAMPDTGLRHKPSPDEWCIKEIVGHTLETDLLFSRRVRAILGDGGVPRIDSPIPPWKLQDGKGYDDMTADELIVRFREARAASLLLVRGLTSEQWARRGVMRTASPSVLDLGTWLANHDRGHLAQIRRLGESAGAR